MVLKKPSLILLLLAILITSSIFVIRPTQAVVSPTAIVASVEHPDTVLPGQVFPVVITVNYSDSFLTDVGIMDAQSGSMIQSVTLISSFTGPGKSNFTFHLIAPLSRGEWNLIAMTRVWWRDAWYMDANGGTSLFTVAISDMFRVSFSSQAPNATITVDGSSYTIPQPVPMVIELSVGRHTVEASPIINIGSGSRFVFAGWSDGVSSNPRNIIVTRNLDITAQYRRQFRLSVTPENGRAYGSGWYDEGSGAHAAALPGYDSTSWPFTKHFAFARWKVSASSTLPVTIILMNSARTAQAEWAISSTEIDFTAVAYAIFVAAIPLAARAAYLAIKRYQFGFPSRRASGLLRILLLTLILVSLVLIPQVHGQLPAQSGSSSIIHVGDADWYYWKHPTSDTCILWLGGGISQETVIGYNYYWINPFDYESFGTIRFLQDLAKHYSMIALQKGGYGQYNPAAGRTIYQEAYQIQSTIISDVHAWIQKQGYRHAFVVGYSVGGQAAAMEITLRDPIGWTSQDGVVLITTPLQLSIVQHSHEVRTNFAFYYGGNLPEFVATGQQFYDGAPAEGWHGSAYIHKELHVLGEVGHEIWTVRATGEYTQRGANLVAAFIERSKALQFNVQPTSPTVPSNLTKIISVGAPQTVEPNAIFQTNGNITGASAGILALAYDDATSQPISSAYVNPSQTGGSFGLTVASNPNSTEISMSIILLANESDWTVSSPTYHAKVTVSDKVELELDTQIPSMGVSVDGVSYETSTAGRLQIQLPRSNHNVQVPQFLPIDKETRMVFVGWSDSSGPATRNVYLLTDTKLNALYKTQYYVGVSSQYGTTVGTGWHDANSTIEVSITPPLITQAEVVFHSWNGDSDQVEPSVLVLVDSPKHLQASWESVNGQQPVNGPGSVALLLASVTLFLILFYSNVVLAKAMRRSKN